MLAIVDPVVSRAQSVLQEKNAVSGYERTVVCAGIDEYDGEIPDAVFIGTPPAFRGTMAPGRNIEVAVSKKFPSAALFVEKPISSSFPEDVVPLIPYFQAHESLVAVGYMLRYLQGILLLFCGTVDMTSGAENENHNQGEGTRSSEHKCLVSIYLCQRG